MHLADVFFKTTFKQGQGQQKQSKQQKNNNNASVVTSLG